MKQQNLDGLLKEWARTTEPDAATVERLKGGIAWRLEHLSASRAEGEARSTFELCWCWCLACVLLVLGCCFFLRGAGRPGPAAQQAAVAPTAELSDDADAEVEALIQKALSPLCKLPQADMDVIKQSHREKRLANKAVRRAVKRQTGAWPCANSSSPVLHPHCEDLPAIQEKPQEKREDDGGSNFKGPGPFTRCFGFSHVAGSDAGKYQGEIG